MQANVKIAYYLMSFSRFIEDMQSLLDGEKTIVMKKRKDWFWPRY